MTLSPEEQPVPIRLRFKSGTMKDGLTVPLSGTDKTP